MLAKNVNPWNKSATDLFFAEIPTGTPGALLVPDIGRGIEVKIASTPDEWRQTFQLVADNYQACGYEEGASKYRFTSFHILPDTVVLVAKEKDRVVGTLSVVPDNILLGLPLEKICPDEVTQLREAGRRIFEFSALASRDLERRTWIGVLTALTRLAWQTMLHCGANTGVIACTEQHGRFYCRTYGFLPLALQRVYEFVCGTSADSFWHDPATIQLRVPGMYRSLFSEAIPKASLSRTPLPPELMLHFSQNSSQTNPQIVAEILSYVEEFGSPRRW
jgi:hypothetical protein